MNAAWLVAEFVIYTFALVVLYRQSYNFLFLLARCPVTWIVVVGLLGILNMTVAYWFGWDPPLVGAAASTAFILNLVPSSPAGQTKREMRTMVNEIYEELGLPHGRVQSKTGLAVFGLCSIGSYVLFFVRALSYSMQR